MSKPPPPQADYAACSYTSYSVRCDAKFPELRAPARAWNRFAIRVVASAPGGATGGAPGGTGCVCLLLNWLDLGGDGACTPPAGALNSFLARAAAAGRAGRAALNQRARPAGALSRRPLAHHPPHCSSAASLSFQVDKFLQGVFSRTRAYLAANPAAEGAAAPAEAAAPAA